MKKRLYTFFTAVLMIQFCLSISSAQTLKEAVEGLSQDVVESYASSAINPFAANLNSAWLNRVPAAEKLGFSVSFGVYGMLSPIKTDAETFAHTSSFYLTEAQATQIVNDEIDDADIRTQVIEQLLNKKFNLTVSGPTIASDVDGTIEISTIADGELKFKIKDPKIPFSVDVELENEQTYDVEIGNFLQAYSQLPYGTAQFNFGTIYGTEAMVRFIPSVEVDSEVGKVGMYGFGLLHNPQAYISSQLPIEVSLGFMYQNFYTDNNGDITAFSAGLNVRKSIEAGWLTISPFANFMIESTNINLKEERTIETNYGQETFTLSYEAKGENSSRFGLGTVFRIAFIDLTFSYNFSTYNSMVGGISFNFDTF